MDPLSVIFFVIIGFSLFGLLNRYFSVEKLCSNFKIQLDRIVSDAESEKGTRRRRNHDLENRIRKLEGKPQLQPYDDPET